MMPHHYFRIEEFSKKNDLTFFGEELLEFAQHPFKHSLSIHEYMLLKTLQTLTWDNLNMDMSSTFEGLLLISRFQGH